VAFVTTALATQDRWIFSRSVDLLVFTLPAALSLALVLLAPAELRSADSPEWVWVTGILLVDVAHVWSTGVVTYLNPAELRRHSSRYWLVPLAGWVCGVALFSLGGRTWFWRGLAYLAVFHFVRQQFGWMALYRARAGDRSRGGAIIDGAAIYAATLYPLIFWHAHLPRRFDWFLPGDFVPGLPLVAARLAGGLYVICLTLYLARAVLELRKVSTIPWGKHLLLLTTAVIWYTGIVAFDGDYVFTVTNVFVHGIPYAALIYSFARHTKSFEPGPGARLVSGRGALIRFLGLLWILAYVEELLWDRALWHERPAWFGAGFDLSSLEVWFVPLLALPQLTHYVLDGFFWRRAQNPNLHSWFTRPRP
jgi:hypothetical protein